MIECYLRSLARFEGFLARNIANLAYHCARRPKTVIGVFLVLAISLIGGLLFTINVITEGRELWVDQESRSMKELEFVEATFEASQRFNTMVVSAKNKGVNVLTYDAVLEALELHEAIRAFKTSEGFDLESICRGFDQEGCQFGGPLNFWDFNLTVFNDTVTNDADVALKCTETVYPNGQFVQRDIDFGSFELVSPTTATAAAMQLAYPTSIGAASVEQLAEWEQGLLDLALETDFQYISVSIFADRSLDDELNKAVGNDIHLMVMAYTIMIVFASFTMGKAGSKLYGRALLASSEVYLIIFCTGAAYGVASILGIPFTSMAQILIFLLVGVGIDIGYVILGAFDATDVSLPVEDRMYEAMYEAGMSITVTSMTDFVAFMLASYTKLPAIQWFGQYAGLAIFFIYLAHLTVFPAMTVLDTKRVQARRADCLVCFKVAEEDDDDEKAIRKQESPLQRFLRDYYGPFLMKPIIKVLVIAVFFGLAGLGGWQAASVKSEFTLKELAPDDSYLQEYYRDLEDLFGSVAGPIPTAMYILEVDYESETVQTQIQQESIRMLTTLDSIDETKGKMDWHAAFSAWATAALTNVTLSTNGDFVIGSDFIPALKTWLGLDFSEPFRTDIVFNEEETAIMSSRIWFFHKETNGSEEEMDALLQTQKFADESPLAPEIFVSSPVYIFYDQYVIIIPQTISSIGFALIAVVAICTILLIHPLSMLILVLVLAMVFTNIIGSIPLWGLSLNSVSAINLLLAIGLVVDYAAHISYVFGLQDHDLPRNQRVINTLAQIGPAVILAVTTTFLGVLPLAFASSQVFRVFFKMFFSIVLSGGLHGLVFLPVVLSIIGPSIPRPEHLQQHKTKNKQLQITPTSEI